MSGAEEIDEPYEKPAEKMPRMKPKDAATLILIRGGREVMMGQRAKGHVFMPDKWVFPGGRVDPEDTRAPAATEFSPETEALLIARGTKRPARAFGLAAARETLEEAGLRLGGPAGPPLDKLRFVFRAITPPNRSRRFDARFFLADAAEVLLDDTPAGGDELLDVKWFSFEEAGKLDLPTITRFVLKEARAQLVGEQTRPVFTKFVRGKAQMERL